MRVALISDLHANAVALRAVLDDLRRDRIDRVVCLGDVATLGPAPQEVVGRLGDLRCACIMGNHDAFMLDDRLIHSYTESPLIVESVDASRAAVGRAELDALATFRATLEVPLDVATLGLFHGSPRSHTEDLLATTPADAVDHALGPRRHTVMAGGHTHLQMVRQHRGTLLVNPGSVGLPFEAHVHGGPPRILAHAEYAVVECVRGAIAVTLRRIPLDKAALAAALDGWDNPLRSSLRQQYVPIGAGLV